MHTTVIRYRTSLAARPTLLLSDGSSVALACHRSPRGEPARRVARKLIASTNIHLSVLISLFCGLVCAFWPNMSSVPAALKLRAGYVTHKSN